MVLSSSRVTYFIVFVLNIHINSGQECVWNLNRDLPANDPIYLKNGIHPELLIPNETGLKLALNESMVLLCSGNSNTLSVNGLQEITATCIDNNQLSYNGANYTLKGLSCKKPSYSDLKSTGLKCADGNGEILKIGFSSSKGLVPLIDVCYNKLNETTFYSNHTLYGKAILGAQSQNKRPNFKINGLGNGRLVSNQYKRKEQTKRFTTLLGSELAEKYINKKSFLSRGHLAPGGDFIFRTWRFSSFYLANVAPEWQTVNGGNWAKVEKLARNLASKRQENLTIYTGTHGVLNMQDSKNTPTDLYLLDGLKLKVPKWFWKVIYSPSTSQGIAMITLNNPHVTNVTKSELMCKNICVGTNWQRTDWTKFDKGYTYCCNVNDLTKTITFLPKMNIVSNLLGNGITDKIPRRPKYIKTTK